MAPCTASRRATLFVATLLAGLWPVALTAQATRSFELCFTGGVASCSVLTLTATNFGGFTALDVAVRHREGVGPLAAPRSVLGGFFVAYDANVFGPAPGTGAFPPLVEAEGGAPDVLVPEAWTQQESVAGDPLRWVGFGATTAETLDGSDRLAMYGIGGCGVAAAMGEIDALFITPHWSCGDGFYRFTTAVDGAFDLALVQSIGVDTYATFAGEAFGTSAFCTALLDGSDSFGTDGVEFGAVCQARALTGGVPVPEPAPTQLLVLAALAAVRWGRRCGTSADAVWQ